MTSHSSHASNASSGSDNTNGSSPPPPYEEPLVRLISGNSTAARRSSVGVDTASEYEQLKHLLQLNQFPGDEICLHDHIGSLQSLAPYLRQNSDSGWAEAWLHECREQIGIDKERSLETARHLRLVFFRYDQLEQDESRILEGMAAGTSENAEEHTLRDKLRRRRGRYTRRCARWSMIY